ncbi:MAG: nucleotidyltransferase domain-containing protein [Bacillota bacterium]
MDDRCRRALDATLSELRDDPEVVGVVWTGSFQQGSPDRNSDIDLYVVTHKRLTWRTTRRYADVTVELFVNNVASMRWRITRPGEIAAAAGFATGEVLLDRTGEVRELQAVARERWEAPAPPLTAEQVKLLRYALTDMADDLEDVEHDPVSSRIVGAALVQQAMEAFCRLHQHHGAKHKRLHGYVAERDPLLGVMIRDYYARAMHPKTAQEIVNYVLAPVGGRLVEWESEKVPYPNEGGDTR